MKKTFLALCLTSCLSPAFATDDTLAFSYASTKSLIQPIDITEEFTRGGGVLDLSSGSLTFRVKSGSSFGAMLGASNPNSNTEYLNFYSMPRNGKDIFGIEIRNGANLIPNNSLTASIDQTNGFHNITYTFDQNNQQINIYVDGTKITTHSASKFFADIGSLSKVYLGQTERHTDHNMRFSGEVFYFDLDETVLSEQDIQQKHQQITDLHNYSLTKREATGAYKSDAYPVFQTGQGGAKNYRIPSLLTTQNGVVIAAIDKRNQHHWDWGNIDTVIRRSFDGGQTWQEDQVIIDLASQSYGEENAAFLIDPLMVQDKNTGRIFMLVDMFPEMRGLFGFGANAQGSGYFTTKEGEQYRILTDSSNNLYTVRENGVVYDENNQQTEYRVVVEGTQSLAYQDIGDLYLNDQRVGNIFLNTQQDNNDSAPLTAKQTSYLWLTYSDDDGATWSNPVDITPQVKADWMQFLGVGPGNGIQLKNGNLVMPVYYTNNTGKLNSQSAALLISEDGGKTWVRGQSPIDRWEYANGGSQALNNSNKQLTESQVIELDNGEIKLFSRNLSGKVVISTSKDGGYTWTNNKIVDDILLDPYSQLSVIKYSKRINGKEIIIFANPHSASRSRVNGKVWLGEVQNDGSIEWKYNTSITTGSYAYNSLTELPNGDIGLLYEESNQKIQYVALNIQELVWHDNYLHRDSRAEPFNFELNSPQEETFYKIGDGEIIKIGEGINFANIEVYEGTVTLNQSADSNGQQQAFNQAIVHQAGTLKLANSNQVPLQNIILNQGTLDLNGQSLTLANTGYDTGLYSSAIQGNILNHNNSEVTIDYNLSGERSFTGQLGDAQGKINIVYQPDNQRSNLKLYGESVLNQLDVKTGRITYAKDSLHLAQQVSVAPNAELFLEGNVAAEIKQLNLALDGKVIIANDNQQYTQLLANSSGEGNIIKQGAGTLLLDGNFAHTGQTNIHQGTLILEGTLAGDLNLENNALLTGNGRVLGTSYWKQGALIQPNLQTNLLQNSSTRNTSTFTASNLYLNNIQDNGATVLLNINNNSDIVNNWEADRLFIMGNVTTSNALGYIPVTLQLLGTGAGKTDLNNNGQYDPDEGISLIQIGGTAELGIFRSTAVNVANSPYSYTLVAVDKGSSVASENQVNNNGSDYYDYRLQAVLEDENGQIIEPVISQQTNNNKANVRTQLKSHIPSYLVSSIATLSIGDKLRQSFTQQFEQSEGLYLLQNYQQTNYSSNLGFTEYGYGYKTKENMTALGLNQTLSNHTQLNIMVSYGQANVEPKAEQQSKTKYKSTGIMAGLNYQLDNIAIKGGLGYHFHRGKTDSISTIKGKQYQLFSQVEYQIPMSKNLSLIPILGLAYQQLDYKIDDPALNVNADKHNVFSQYLGTKLSYQFNQLALNLSALYENNYEKAHYIYINNDKFKTGKLGNALVLGATVNMNITPNLNLGMAINHRAAVSSAKRQDSSVTAKLEFKF